ncbi:unnamed protein product, partial [Brassica rapa]
THEHTRTATSVLCVQTDTHGRPPTWAKVTQTVHGKGQRTESKDQLHGKGQRTESKDQRADMCTDGQPRTSCVHGGPVCADGHTQTATDVLCVLTDSHRQPRTSCV